MECTLSKCCNWILAATAPAGARMTADLRIKVAEPLIASKRNLFNFLLQQVECVEHQEEVLVTTERMCHYGLK